MLSRLLLLCVAILPLAAQDDIDKFLTETRANRPDPAVVQRQLEDQAIFNAKLLLQTLKDPIERAQRYRTLGEIYGRRLDFDASAAAYRKALELRPGAEDLSIALAKILMDAGKPEEAAALFDIDPNDAVALLRKAELLVITRAGDSELALQLALRAKAVAPEGLDADDMIASLPLQKGDFATSRRRFEELIAKAPDVARFRIHFGMALYVMEAFADARGQLEKALECSPTHDESVLAHEMLTAVRNIVLK